ncbi:CHAT domain-containing protein, partial [Leptolyngbya sp. FACHB-711]|uniref:CHAT domain-containing protein n=1 Tax=Leptolyngbya sp. FACHB-711 TaxID=2692813 RepID=UPI0016843753
SGCGELHRAKGRIHYQYGLQQQEHLLFWDRAHKSYEDALQFFGAQDFPEERLEVIGELIQVFLALEKIEEAKHLQREGLDLLNRLLSQAAALSKKRYLALKFTGFNQLTVDIKVKSGRILEAWETAEEGKNICLKWLLWEQDLLVPRYDEAQQLLDPSTAVIYWHLSPSALTTFLLKSDTLTPILVNSASSSTGKIPESLDRLIKLENWVMAWDERYANYRDKGKTDVEDKQSHPWRFSMEAALEDLKKLLCISEIEAELSNINKLILIPHRDLHRFPLHVLFNEQFSITYLPSVRVGLDLQKRSSIEPWQLQPLLNVDDPAVDGVDQMPYAQLESAVVQKLFSTSVSITREQATKAAVTEALENNYQVFHFTGHGEYNGDRPEMSQLGLADGCLTATEIGRLNLSPYNLVTIAACETALTGNQTMTTEYVGLVSAFLKAKVSHVLSTLWTVEEVSNAWIVIRFYQFLLEGVAPASALARAQQWLRTITDADLAAWLTKISHLEGLDPLIKQDLEQQAYSLENSSTIALGGSVYSHPYYWAAFTLTGRGFL